MICLTLLAMSSLSQASTPYSGTAISIPGTIEMENYDLGGAGDAYYDVDAGNNGSASYRSDDVDHETCSEGGFNVGWTETGEWLKYTVNVVTNGSYTITARVASEATTGAFHIEVDDVDATGPISVSTGGWQTWEDRTSIVTLSAGEQIIKLVIEGPSANIDRFDVTYNGPPPAEPTGLQVDSTAANSVSLSWTAPASGSPTGYNVKRATTSNGTYAVVGTTTAPTVAFTDSVTGGSTYYYVVSALTASGESDDSSFVSATPALGVPDAPTDLSASAGDNLVSLSWTAPAIGNPTHYNILRSTTSGSGYAAITTSGAQTSTSYTDSTAVNGTTYYYVVSAENATGEGANATEVNATPSVFSGYYESFDYPIDSNLDNGTAATADGFTSWTCGVSGWITTGLTYSDLPTDNNAMRTPSGRQSVGLEDPLSSGTKWISFLYNTSAGNPGGNMNGVYFPNGTTGLYFGFGMSPYSGTQGYLGLGSINTAGTAVQTASLLQQLDLGTYGETILVAMKIQFDTSGANDTITVYLNPVANTASPSGTGWILSSFDVGTISGIGMQVTGGGEITVDEIRIADSYSDVVDAVTIAPDAPTGLNATAGTNRVSLSWTAATGGLPTSYHVKRSSSSAGPYTTVGTTTVPTVSYTDSIIGGQTYYYVVSAENGIGESADSASVSATPTLAAPATPTGFTATADDSQVSLSWTASPFATGYDVQRSTAYSGPYTSIGSTASTMLVDTGLSNATTYYFVVAATGAGGSSAYTSPISATPFGPQPLVLGIERGVGITWFASNSITYQVQWTDEDRGTNTVWNNLGESRSGDGTTNTVFDPDGTSSSHYQVLSIQ
jgi:fibronectin type 3 domain-containing protein